MCITFVSTIDTNNKKQLRVIESIAEAVLHHGRGGVIEQSISSHRGQTRTYVYSSALSLPSFILSRLPVHALVASHQSACLSCQLLPSDNTSQTDSQVCPTSLLRD